MQNRKTALIFVFISILIHLSADETVDKIEIKPSLLGLGNIYLMDDESLTIRDLNDVLRVYPESESYAKKARVPLFIGAGFAVVGGGVVGYELGYSLTSGEDTNWGIFGIGAASIIVGHIFGGLADNQYEKGVVYFNQQ